MERIRARLGFQGLLVVEAQGRSGGLALLWKETDQIKLISLSNHHIDVEVSINGMQPWRLTGFYGEPNRSQRRKTWDLLRNLARDSNLLWCIIGDMNNIVSQADKKGGVLYPQWLLDGFNGVLVEARLTDLKLYVHQFTWERGRNTSSWLEIRLDRAMANNSWVELFPIAKLYNLEGSPSDHNPLFLEPLCRSKMIGRRRFRFENAWLMEPLCRQIVKDNWEDDTFDIVQKVKQCGKILSLWGKEVTGCFGKRIKDCKARLKYLRGKQDASSVQEFLEAKQQLFLILDQKEIFWRQRSKQLWLQAGDKNTKYFHASCNTRQRTNRIQKLKMRLENGWTGRMAFNLLSQIITTICSRPHSRAAIR